SLEDFPGDFFTCDLSSQTETAELLKVLVSTYDITGLVNNVGAGGPQPLEAIDLDTLMDLYNINVRTAVQMTQGLVERMKEKNVGVL
ncbi:MAG TPA: SDR family NAD(P)-dependent oxidoreductase, partial [Parachlamydiaceae bacterium]|nr:SDR family NAD(P)-dependent oxidoreductase [Parachlamydiaceae bacterium]